MEIFRPYFRRTIFVLIGLMLSYASAQSVDSLFVKANKLYQQEKYTEALGLYKQIEEQGIVSSELFYNLGNVYYKSNQVAPSIYYYEKALKLNPNDGDVLFNLEFAKRMTLDNIEPLPKSLGDKYRENIVLGTSYNTWATLAVVFAILFAILFLLYHFSRYTHRKRFFFVSSSICAILVFVAVAFAYQNKNLVDKTQYAIVFTANVNVKNAPTQNSDINFQLHEGTKVQILETLDNWKKIKIADGKIGWLDASEIKEL
ncbi:tetratricopeptide repeat protein [Namhaeicola litoreus]|uniref:Tetratricopeptide repeat protein n=1 Tax=Namhaeicola litoreus TaxID=1052145 RepID=A0ABW3Y1N5_9FLAO